MKGSEPPRIKSSINLKTQTTMKNNKIYMLRYSIQGINDGIRLFNNLESAQNQAEAAINWGAYKATIYATNTIYKHEIEYKEVKTYYNK